MHGFGGLGWVQLSEYLCIICAYGFVQEHASSTDKEMER